jgi:hypothetical protein
VTANRGLAINDYVLVIQAVMEGQGVALGWQHLTERLVSSGLLRKVTGAQAGYRGRVPCDLAKGAAALAAIEAGAGLACNEGREVSE